MKLITALLGLTLLARAEATLLASDWADPSYPAAMAANAGQQQNPDYDARGHFSRCVVPNTVALTYDDGPGAYTGQLLDILKSLNATVSFCVIGENLDNPDYTAFTQRAFNEGHMILSHTYTHINMSASTLDTITTEMEKTRASIKKAIGRTVRYMRPPYGEINQQAYTYLFANDYRVITWNVDPTDWQTLNTVQDETDVETQTNQILATGPNGIIILNHDIYTTTVAAASTIIQFLQSKNLRLVTVEECVGMKPGDAYLETYNQPIPTSTPTKTPYSTGQPDSASTMTKVFSGFLSVLLAFVWW